MEKRGIFLFDWKADASPQFDMFLQQSRSKTPMEGRIRPSIVNIYGILAAVFGRLSLSALFFVFAHPNLTKMEDRIMAEYKRIPLETVEHTEVAHNRYLDFQRSKDAPDEVEVEAEWLLRRRRLYDLLDRLTPRQRQVYILRLGYGMKEDKIAEQLHISQSTVSRHLKLSDKKIQKVLADLTDK